MKPGSRDKNPMLWISLLFPGGIMLFWGFIVLFNFTSSHGMDKSPDPNNTPSRDIPLSMALIFGGGGLIQAAMSLLALQRTIGDLRERIEKLEKGGQS